MVRSLLQKYNNVLGATVENTGVLFFKDRLYPLNIEDAKKLGKVIKDIFDFKYSEKILSFESILGKPILIKVTESSTYFNETRMNTSGVLQIIEYSYRPGIDYDLKLDCGLENGLDVVKLHKEDFATFIYEDSTITLPSSCNYCDAVDLIESMKFERLEAYKSTEESRKETNIFDRR